MVDPSGLEDAPKVKVTPLSAPLLGANGYFKLPVRFSLDKATATGGYIVQEIEIKFEYKDAKDMDITDKFIDNIGKVKFHFWEVWKIDEKKDAVNPDTSPDLAISPYGFDNARKELEREAEYLKKGSPEHALLIQASKDVAGEKWKGLNDVFGNARIESPILFKSSKVTYTASVFLWIASSFPHLSKGQVVKTPKIITRMHRQVICAIFR